MLRIACAGLPHLPLSPPISPYLVGEEEEHRLRRAPMSPHVSPYLPISPPHLPHISPHQASDLLPAASVPSPARVQLVEHNKMVVRF